MNSLHVHNLTKKFGVKSVIQPLTFSLQPNTSTALIGPNGAGKTTIMSMIAGLLTPTTGTIQFGEAKDIRQMIGFLPQYPSFFSYMTALEYVEMAASLSNVQKKLVKSRSLEVLEYVGLSQHIHSKITTFSGGMKQRLGIAQAIIHQPKLLLLDEPVSALDPIGRQEVMNLIKDLEKSMTILYSTHILNDAERMTNQVLFLKDGAIVESGKLEDIQKKYAEPRIIVKFKLPNEANQFALENNYQVVNTQVIIDLIQQPIEMNELLSMLSQTTFTIEKVEKMTASLEEIFMKVVN